MSWIEIGIANINWIEVIVATGLGTIITIFLQNLIFTPTASYCTGDQESFLREMVNGFGIKKYYQRGIHEDNWHEITKKEFDEIKGARRAID